MTLQKLNDDQIKVIINEANTTYNNITEENGDYDLWHDIASGSAYINYRITDEDYDAKFLDSKCLEFADFDDDDMSDIPLERDMDQYFR